MKKVILLSITAILFIGLLASNVIVAQNKDEVKKSISKDNSMVQNQNRGRYYVDKNQDGICDNYNLGRGKGMGRSGSGRGRNFVDNDNDGKCDNFSLRTGRGRSLGSGRNFVDKNKDGICDNRREGTGRGRGKCDGTHKGHKGSR